SLSGTTLQRNLSGGSLTGFTLARKNGSKSHYGYLVTLGGAQHALLTDDVDRFGHTNRFEYAQSGGNYLLQRLIDADGRTNTLSYTNTAFPANITSVQDPFGRTAYLKYDQTGLLTNIIDPVGLSSSFKYDQNTW